ncbi:MAG TPA: hypothetical protein DEP35_24840 [Deltaproteobacteria bacterium]|nr:hypothetical protein [Deltaproteobacteria bacterium]
MPPEGVAGCEDSYLLTVAPRFHLRRSFVGRIDRNSGVEESGDPLRPRDDWRSVSAQELSALLKEVPGVGTALPATHLGLLEIPERIRRAWWKEAERSHENESFQGVFSSLIEFLRFKKLPFPDIVHLEVAVNAPGLASTRAGSSGACQGLAYRDRPAVGKGRARQTLGLVNLGDEASFVILLPLPPSTLAARLEAAGESRASALSPDTLVNRYFGFFPREGLLRLRLEPGEGLWLSPRGVVHDGWTRGKRDLDVVLSLRTEVGGEESEKPVEEGAVHQIEMGK